jgi:hypothetical protein
VLAILTGPATVVFGKCSVVAQPFVVGSLESGRIIRHFLPLFSVKFRIHKKTLLLGYRISSQLKPCRGTLWQPDAGKLHSAILTQAERTDMHDSMSFGRRNNVWHLFGSVKYMQRTRSTNRKNLKQPLIRLAGEVAVPGVKRKHRRQAGKKVVYDGE